jgi:hypothetical protein
MTKLAATGVAASESVRRNDAPVSVPAAMREIVQRIPDQVAEVPGDHLGLLRRPAVAAVGEHVRAPLARIALRVATARFDERRTTSG